MSKLAGIIISIKTEQITDFYVIDCWKKDS